MIRITAAVIGAAFAASGANAQDQRYFTCSTQYGSGPNLTVYVSEVFRYEYVLGDKAASDFKSYLTERYGFKTYANCPAFPVADQATKHFEYVQSYARQNNARVSVERWAPAGASSAEVMAASPKTSPQSAAAAPTATHAAPQKYVEVDGPNGKMRLSPEVAARNQAAAEEYRRKMDEHARDKAEHERNLALHQQSIAAAAAERRAYEQKLALNDAQVAAHGAALEQHKAATRPPAKGAKAWMYCDARGAAGDKRRYYSRVTEVSYVPGEITIIDVMARNRPAFKSYVAGTHSIFFATDSLLHCPYSTTSLADAEALMTRDKRGDGNSGIEVVQTGWLPAS